jgi:glycerophosphoryl diester phosphodiesterase
MRPIQILAHRGNMRGPNRAFENTLGAVSEALECGFGIETDIRLDPLDGLYISHDSHPVNEGNAFSAHANLWRKHPSALIAVNIKELGYESQLLQSFEEQAVLRQLFLFDMELIEAVPGATAGKLPQLNPSVALAARVSDRSEPIAQALAISVANNVWLDEFDTPWADRVGVQTLKAAGRNVYAVSPDLHGYPLEQSILRWHDMLAWGVDGICTDWPLLLREEIRRIDNEGIAK